LRPVRFNAAFTNMGSVYSALPAFTKASVNRA
jgi:hypothetical protein